MPNQRPNTTRTTFEKMTCIAASYTRTLVALIVHRWRTPKRTLRPT